MITDYITSSINYVHIHADTVSAFLVGTIPKSLEVELDNQCFYINHNRQLDYCHVFQIKNGYPVYHGMTRFTFIDAFSKYEILEKIEKYLEDTKAFIRVHSFMTQLLNRTFKYTYSDLNNDSFVDTNNKLICSFFK